MEDEKKLNFFQRLKIAIFNVEDYKIFIKENFGTAFKYGLILIAIITVITSIVTTFTIRQKFDKVVSYVKTDFPDFSYADGNLTVDEKVESYDKENDARLIVDTSDNVSEDEIKEYKDKSTESTYSLILLKDKAIYSIFGKNSSGNFVGENIESAEVKYTDFMDGFGIKTLNKDELFSNYFNDSGIVKITFVIFIYAILILFMTNILTVLEDVLIIAIFGWIASKLCRVKLSFKNNCSLAVYSVSLSLILSMIYAIVNTFTGFEIKYFSLMYMIIAYIYIIAAIMIIKADPSIKNMQEIPVNEDKKVIKVEKVEENKEDKNEDKQTKDKEEDKNKKQQKKENEKKSPEGEGA